MLIVKSRLLRLLALGCVQIFVSTSLDIPQALAAPHDQVFQKTSLSHNTLAAPSSSASLHKVLKNPHNFSEKFSPSLQSTPASDHLSKQVRDVVRRHLGVAFWGGFGHWLKSDQGIEYIKDIWQALIKEGFDQLEIFDVLEGTWEYLLQDGIARTATEAGQRLNGHQSDVKALIKGRLLPRKDQVERLKDLSSSHQGDLLQEVVAARDSFQWYRSLDLELDSKSWTNNYAMFIDMARSLAQKKSITFTDRQGKQGFLGSTVDVVKDIIWHNSDFELRLAMGGQEDGQLPDDQVERIRRKVLSFLDIFERSSGEPSDPQNALSLKAFKLFQEYEYEHMNIEQREEDLLGGKRRHASKTFRQIWIDKGYDPKDLNQSLLAAIADTTVGDFKMSKKYMGIVTFSPLMNYRFYRDYAERKTLPGLLKPVHSALKIAIAVGLVGIFFYAPAWGLVIFPLMYFLFAGGAQSLYRIFNTPDLPLSKKILTVAVVGGLTIGSFFLGLAVIESLLAIGGVLGFAPIFSQGVLSRIIFPLLSFRLSTWILGVFYADTHNQEEVSWIGPRRNVRSYLQRAMNWGDGADLQVTRNSRMGMVLADIAGVMHWNQQVLEDYELKRAGVIGDNPRNYTMSTMSMLYFLDRERTYYYDDYRGSDHLTQSDANMTAIIAQRQKEARKIVDSGILKEYQRVESYNDLLEYEVIGRTRDFISDAEMAYSELVTGKNDKAPSHALAMGFDGIEKQTARILKLAKKHGVDLREADVTEHMQSDRKDQIIDRFLAAGLPPKDITTIGTPLALLNRYYKSLKATLLKLERQRHDLFEFGVRYNILEDWQAWSQDSKDNPLQNPQNVLVTHKPDQQLTELKIQLKLGEDEPVKLSSDFMTVQISDVRFKQSIDKHRKSLGRLERFPYKNFGELWQAFIALQKASENPQEKSVGSLNTVNELIRLRHFVNDILSDQLEWSSQKQSLFLGNPRQLGVLRDVYFLKKLKDYGMTANMGKEKRDQVKKQIEEDLKPMLQETDLFDIEVLKRILTTIELTNLRGEQEFTETVDAVRNKWRVDFKDQLNLYGLGDLLGIFQKNYEQTEGHEYQAFVEKNYRQNFRNWRKQDYLERRALSKLAYYVYNNGDKRVVRAPGIDQLAEYAMSIHYNEDDHNKREDLKFENSVHLKQDDYEQMRSEYKNVKKYWEEAAHKAYDAMRKLEEKKAYKTRFAKHMDFFWRLEQDPHGYVGHNKKWTFSKIGDALLKLGFGVALGYGLSFAFSSIVTYVVTNFQVVGNLLFNMFTGSVASSSGTFLVFSSSLAPIVLGIGITFVVLGTTWFLYRLKQRQNLQTRRLLGSHRTSLWGPSMFLLVGLGFALMPYYWVPMWSFLLGVGVPGIGSLLLIALGLIGLIVGVSREKEAKSWGLGLMGLSFLMLFVSGSLPALTLGLVVLSSFILVRWGASLIVRNERWIAGGAAFSAGLMLVFFYIQLFVSTMVLSGTVLVIVQALPYLILVLGLYRLLESWRDPQAVLFHKDHHIVKDIDSLKELMERNDFLFQAGSINPLTVLRRYFRTRYFEQKVMRLRLQMQLQYGQGSNDSQTIESNARKALSQLQGDRKREDLETDMAIVRMALLAKHMHPKKVLYRNLDIENRVMSSELHNVLDLPAKVDTYRKIRKDPNVKISAKNRYKLEYLEEGLDSLYFKMVFGIALGLTFLFTLLITFTAGAVGLSLVKILYAYILPPVLFVMLLTNAEVFTSKFVHKNLQPRINPEAEQPYGLLKKGGIGTLSYIGGVPGMRGWGNNKDMLTDMEHERILDISYSLRDEWFQAQWESMENNPHTNLLIAGNSTTLKYMVYDLMHMARLAERFGWERIFFMTRRQNWLVKPGQIQDAQAFLSGRDLNTELYHMETGWHTGLRYDASARDLFNPYLREHVLIGGGRYDPSNPLDRLKKYKLEVMQKELLDGFSRFHKTQDERILEDIGERFLMGPKEKNKLEYEKISKGARTFYSTGPFERDLKADLGRSTVEYDKKAYRPGEAYKNDGIGTDFFSDKTKSYLRTENMRLGINYYNGFDDDNTMPLKFQRQIYSASETRYMRNVGNQQPRTKGTNAADTVFASITSYAHDNLIFTQQGLYTTQNTYSDYGKGSKILHQWYMAFTAAHKIKQDTLSHDTQEAPGSFKHFFMHNMGFSMFNVNRQVGEGQATNFVASMTRVGRWLFGTMQDQENLAEPGSARQKWISFLGIKGYWGELVFFSYLLLGFLAVLFNLLQLTSSILFPTMIMVGLFFASMYMILASAKFRDLDLVVGGNKKNFKLSFAETVLSTAIYLNNPLTVSGLDVREVRNRVQKRAIGLPMDLPWIPSAVVETFFKSPTARQSLQKMHLQVKLAIGLMSIIMFSLLFIPFLSTSPLVWSTVIVYFIWASPLYFSWFFGWYFSHLAGQDRDAMKSALNILVNGEDASGVHAKTSNVLVEQAMTDSWGYSRFDEYRNPVVWDKGLLNHYGQSMLDIRDYLEFEDQPEKQKLQALVTRERTAYEVNDFTRRLMRIASFTSIFLGLFGALNLFLLGGLVWVGAFAAPSLPVMIFLVAVGLVGLFVTKLMKAHKTFDPMDYQLENSEEQYGLKKTNFAQTYMVVVGLGLLLISVLSILNVGLFPFLLSLNSFAQGFSFVVGFVWFILGVQGIRKTRWSKEKYKVFRSKTPQDAVVDYRKTLKERMWERRKNPLHALEQQNLIKRLSPEGSEKLTKEYFYQNFEDLAYLERQASNRSLNRGSLLDSTNVRKGGKEVTSLYTQRRHSLLEQHDIPSYMYFLVRDLGEQQDLPETSRSLDFAYYLGSEKIYDALKAAGYARTEKDLLRFVYRDLAIDFDLVGSDFKKLRDNRFLSHLMTVLGAKIDNQEANHLLQAFFEELYGPTRLPDPRYDPQNVIDAAGGEISLVQLKAFYLDVRNLEEFRRYIVQIEPELEDGFAAELQRKFEDTQGNLVSWVRQLKRVRQDVNFEQFYERELDIVRDVFGQISEMRAERNLTGAFRGALGRAFFEEFRDLYVVHKSRDYFGNLQELLASRPDLLQKVSFKPVQVDGEDILALDFGQSNKELVDVFLDELATLNERTWKHGDRILKMLWQQAGGDVHVLARIFQESPGVQAAALVAQIQSLNPSDFKKALEAYFDDLNPENYDLKKRQLRLLKSFPQMFLNAFHGSNQTEVQKELVDYVAYLSSYVLDKPEALDAFFFQIPQSIDLSSEQSKEQSLKHIDSMFMRIIDTGKVLSLENKNMEIFYRYAKVFSETYHNELNAVSVDGQTLQQRFWKLFEKEEKKRLNVDKLYLFDEGTRAEFTWLKGWRIPKNFNEITLYQIFRKALFYGALGVVGTIMGYAMFTIVVNMGIIFATPAVVISGGFFIWAAIFSASFWLLVGKVQKIGWNAADFDVQRDVNLMGLDAAKRVRNKSHYAALAFSSIIFLALGLLTFLTAPFNLPTLMGAATVITAAHHFVQKYFAEEFRVRELARSMKNRSEDLQSYNFIKEVLNKKLPVVVSEQQKRLQALDDLRQLNSAKQHLAETNQKIIDVRAASFPEKETAFLSQANGSLKVAA